MTMTETLNTEVQLNGAALQVRTIILMIEDARVNGEHAYANELWQMLRPLMLPIVHLAAIREGIKAHG